MILMEQIFLANGRMLCSYRLEVPPNPDAVLVPLEEPLDELRFRFRTGDGLNY